MRAGWVSNGMLLAVAALTACKGSGGGNPIGSGTTATMSIGASGGTVTLDGVTLTIPANALSSTVEIKITETSDPAPAPYQAYSPVYKFEPDGTTFSQPVTVAMRFTGDASRAVLYWSAGAGYDPITGSAMGDRYVAQVTHFSSGFVAAMAAAPDLGTPLDGGNPLDAAMPNCPNQTGFFYVACNGACIDAARDPLNCGGCGVACMTGEVCSAASCVPDFELNSWHVPADLPATTDYTTTAGTATDNITGLVWQRDSPSASYTWVDAKAYCAALSLESQTGWRLPTLVELQSIVHYGVFQPSIDSTVFPNTTSTDILIPYWTSSTFAYMLPVTSSAWSIRFNSGDTFFDPKSSTEKVRCVRAPAGPPVRPAQRYVVTADTVADPVTNLTWARATTMNAWAAADAACQAATLGGLSGWRLPTLKELHSLVYTGNTYPNPAIDTAAFPGTSGNAYLSATKNPAGNSAWGIRFDQGNVGLLDLTSSFPIRCVRTGS
jgi:formylglycine-generating enzyme required for sulfatase activity